MPGGWIPPGCAAALGCIRPPKPARRACRAPSLRRGVPWGPCCAIRWSNLPTTKAAQGRGEISISACHTNVCRPYLARDESSSRPRNGRILTLLAIIVMSPPACLTHQCTLHTPITQGSRRQTCGRITRSSILQKAADANRYTDAESNPRYPPGSPESPDRRLYRSPRSVRLLVERLAEIPIGASPADPFACRIVNSQALPSCGLHTLDESPTRLPRHHGCHEGPGGEAHPGPHEIRTSLAPVRSEASLSAV